MIDLLMLLLAALAFTATTIVAIRVYFRETAPVSPFGPVLHFASTSELLEHAARNVANPALAEALEDRAAQLAVHGD